ncbi:MAG: ABC transporter permease subunit [Phycisphaeraceae bacterium]|nr:ABC transporter permease subunit [Phycisphaeraceae bacterium]
MPVFVRWLLRLGPTNPIAVRLVQNGSRRTRHLYIRAAYLAVLIVVLLWLLLVSAGGGNLDYRELARAGAMSFTSIAYLQIGLICILAPVFMAGAIAQESNPRTWEVMLTTPLSATQIVLGNLLGRLFFIIALLMASLPLFALVQYFGGVPGRTILASYLVAACAAVLVGTIAIALSVSRLVGRRAVFAFYVSVVSYLALTAAIDSWVRLSGGGAGGNGVTWMTPINPFLTLHALLNPTAYPRADETGPWALRHPVNAWCWGSVLLSVGLALASTLTVRTGGLQMIAGQSGGVPWYRRMFGLGASGAEHRPPRHVWTNPIAWREAAARNSTLGRIVARWSFIAAGAAWGVALVWMFHTARFTNADFRLAMLFTTIGELAVVALVAVNMSATSISREREDGTLDLLLTTPITPAEYLSGKLRGLIAYLLPLMAVPLGTLALAGIYALTGGLGRAGGVTETVQQAGGLPAITVPVVLPEAGLVASLVVVPFIAFCAIVGMYWSLKSKGTISSVVATVGVVGAISGVIGVCGWRAGVDASLIGPFLAGLSPASVVFALVAPLEAMDSTVRGSGVQAARVTLLVGSVCAAGLYAAIVYGVHSYTVKNFDFIVRRLAGVK